MKPDIDPPQHEGEHHWWPWGTIRDGEPGVRTRATSCSIDGCLARQVQVDSGGGKIVCSVTRPAKNSQTEAYPLIDEGLEIIEGSFETA